MSIEIGSLVVRGSFGRGQDPIEDAVSEARLQDLLDALRRELRDEVTRTADRIERRLRET